MAGSATPLAPASGAWCPEFRPTSEEFASFAKYIRTEVEPKCAHIGICKIIPPEGWFTRSYGPSDLAGCMVSKPVSQHVAGKKGVFNVDLVERKTMNVEEFKKLSESLGHEEPACDLSADAVERLFWKSLRPTMDAPVYGADIVNSLFGDDPAMSWNLNRLDTILRRIDLPGVTQSMLYFGMWRAMFAFHTEDMDLYSINYVHTGKPKFWYAVPPDSAAQLERAAQSLFPEKHHACSQFMRHKTSMMSPSRLKEFGVPYYKAFQQPGEFVITFPATYHQGFNLGFNIAEAVNFASLRWIPFGLKAKVCKCVPDSVRIDMDTFVTKVFDPPPEQANPELLGEDAWIFSCRCNKFASSEEPSFVVDEQWFECSTCKIWAHVRCVHPELAALTEEELPPSMLCHRCRASDDDTTQTTALGSPLSTDGHTTSSTSSHRVAGKRKEREMLTPTKSPVRESVEPTKKPALGSKRKSTARKSLFVKGSTIQFEDTEARIAAVEGKFIRVHYKGQSTHEDEWLPVDSKELQQRIVAVSPPPRILKTSHVKDTKSDRKKPSSSNQQPRDMNALKKDVSVGEYDARSGLTLITLQRGRLMFNMGPPSTKRAAAAAAATTLEAASPPIENTETTDAIRPSDDALPVGDSTAAPSHAPRQIMRVFRSGVFTGRSLFAEEAVYLIQRGALVVYEMEELDAADTAKDATSDTRTPLSLAILMARMLRSNHLRTSSLDVYAFLKDHKLHPRRYLSTADSDAAPPSTTQGRTSTHISVFDVYKSITETLYVTEEIRALRTHDDTGPVVEKDSLPVRRKKRKLKRLALIFRVVVRSFRDAMPRPAELRGLIDAASLASSATSTISTEEKATEENPTRPSRVPVKLAVVNDDRSVVLFEVA